MDGRDLLRALLAGHLHASVAAALVLIALTPFGLRLASEAMAYMFGADRLVLTFLVLPLLALAGSLVVVAVGAWVALGLGLRALLRRLRS